MADDAAPKVEEEPEAPAEPNADSADEPPHEAMAQPRPTAWVTGGGAPTYARAAATPNANAEELDPAPQEEASTDGGPTTMPPRTATASRTAMKGPGPPPTAWKKTTARCGSRASRGTAFHKIGGDASGLAARPELQEGRATPRCRLQNCGRRRRRLRA